MGRIGTYLISVSVAAIICSIIHSLIDEKKPYGSIIKTIAGVFMAITAISPITKIEIAEISDYLERAQMESEMSAEVGTDDAKEAMGEIINQRIEAYVLEKAKSLDLSVDVNVILNNEMPPSPQALEIIGNCSPYNKRILSEFIVNNLGIPEESLIWKPKG